METDALAYRDGSSYQSSVSFANPAGFIEYSSVVTSAVAGSIGAAFMKDRIPAYSLEYSSALATVAAGTPSVPFMDNRMPVSQDSRRPLANAAHRTSSQLDGAYPPLPASTLWLANPGLKSKIRFYADVVVRGPTGLSNDPQITFRPYLRNGGTTGVVGAADSVSVVRPRMRDVDGIYLARTSDSGVNFTDYSTLVTDNSTATIGDLIGLDGNTSCWYAVGGPVPFCGMAVDMDPSAVNDGAVASQTLRYWNGTTWAALSNVTDGTISSATVFRTDGQISWDIPADWTTRALTSLSYTGYFIQGSVTTALTSVAGQTGIQIEELDLLMPIKVAIDLQADGDDALLFLESQDAAVTGSVIISSASLVRHSWR